MQSIVRTDLNRDPVVIIGGGVSELSLAFRSTSEHRDVDFRSGRDNRLQQRQIGHIEVTRSRSFLFQSFQNISQFIHALSLRSEVSGHSTVFL